jgi:hypothetical protein
MTRAEPAVKLAPWMICPRPCSPRMNPRPW